MIPVRLTGKHEGVVVMYSPEEYARLWQDIDREATRMMAMDMDEYMAAHPCECEALCECGDSGV